ncbi:protein kibra isoform X2 [Lutzomyia longipalpis]|uniref:Protein kibra n=2 Tax=Lutzomyia longipalpis TaxID=7200 RepID=A0A7G3AWZ3_LUTLO|nr:protein kibra isoform X2 [Lutzomyia longipalpis]
MPKRHSKNGELQLPNGWEMAQDYDGKIYYIDHISKKTTWIDPRDRYTKPSNFADCIGDELPLGWEEAYDTIIGRYYINHLNQSTQLEDPRQEWKIVQEAMLREYLNSAQDVLEAKKEIFDVKQRRLMLAQDEFNNLNAMAASRTSLYSSSSSISTKFDPELLKADLALSKERVRRLKRELAQITSEISFTQRGVDTLYSVEQKLSSRENGCYNLAEVQAIRDEMIKIQKNLVSGEQEKKELKRSLTQLKYDLTRLQYGNGSPVASALNLAQDRVCASSQTDLCADIFPLGARLAEVAKTRLQYDEWKKRIKFLQQQLADHVERIEPGQLESDKDRLLLIQEKEQFLKELRSIPASSKTPKEMAEIQATCHQLDQELNQEYEYSNQCIANRLRVHEEKQVLLQQLQDALRSTKLLEERLKSLSSGSTFSISSGSSLGSLSTASSKGSLSGLSFTDIYGDPLSTEPQVDMVDLQRRIQSLSHPSEVSLSPRSSLSMETPPASPMKDSSECATKGDEPTYENTKNLDLNNTVLDCMRLEERLQELEFKQSLGLAPQLSPIYEKPSLLDLPQQQIAMSRSSSASNTRSVSAAVSNESVAGDSGVFEASRALLPNREAAQVQIGLKYSKADGVLHISLERARNLTALCLQEQCQMYFKAALLPNSSQTLRTNNFTDFQKPVFGDSFSTPIHLHKVFTKTLQVNAMAIFGGQREECIGCAQVSLAEFNADDATLKWYNILNFRYLNNLETFEVAGACKEESSDESTIISSQTSTLTRNQGQEDAHNAALAMELNQRLNINSDDEEQSAEASGGKDEDEESSTEEDEDQNESTEQMLADYMNEVQNFTPEMADKETNTECAFLPEKARRRLQETAAMSKEPIDDRLVKRSQTFSPSAVVSKNRICRLNRSDSDSAMHFGAATLLHPFQRNSIERRSLRFHNRLPKPVTKIHPSSIPRTSLDLELDLQAQNTKLETLNDEIAKLRDLKQRLEQARDANDAKVAAWALENEDFQKLVESADPKTPDDKKLQKLMHKKSKEIYKLRKTRLGKGQPDIVSFKEKMAFFTRMGMSVPELPTENTSNEDLTLPENPHGPLNPSRRRKIPPPPSYPHGETAQILHTSAEVHPIPTPRTINESIAEETEPDYVVDRNYGVEV